VAGLGKAAKSSLSLGCAKRVHLGSNPHHFYAFGAAALAAEDSNSAERHVQLRPQQTGKGPIGAAVRRRSRQANFWRSLPSAAEGIPACAGLHAHAQSHARPRFRQPQSSLHTGAKQRRAEADFRCAFLDGYFKIVGHSHGKRRQPNLETSG
jgi:hypothetical protein